MKNMNRTSTARMGIRLMALGSGLIAMNAGAAESQSFPSKPIRIVTAQAGGGNDFAARLIAQGLTSSLGRPVIVENRGGSVVLGADIVAKSPPDGYTLLLYGNNLWLLPFLRDKVRYDPLNDFTPITLAVNSPNVLVVNPSLAVKSTKDLIALAKAKPGELNYGGATGGVVHIAAELFKALAAVDIFYVPYKGGAPALNDLIAGQLQLMFSTAGAVSQHLKSGRVRGLAVTSAKPSALLPDLPPVAASVPGYESVSQFAILGPAKMPASHVQLLNQHIVKVVNSADVRQKFENVGIESVGSSPQDLTKIMKAEMATLGKVIHSAGIRADAAH
jgi:tripartite-type tricarboxylate transporter receptor subunit TctC